VKGIAGVAVRIGMNMVAGFTLNERNGWPSLHHLGSQWEW
jgi:hypothetical protein